MISKKALNQIDALMREKKSWNHAQCKIDTHLLLAAKRRLARPLTAGLPQLRSVGNIDSSQNVLVDIKASVSTELLEGIVAVGGTVVNSHAQYDAIRARLPLARLETIAGEDAVIRIRPADQVITNMTNTSEGDVAHGANIARTMSALDGSGVTVGVLSNGVDSLAARQSTGDLPPSVTVLSGQGGTGDEGTAMLEIVHDLAPGATLFFATAMGGQAQFAQNIIDLQTAGCEVIIDDVLYFAEPVFQDGVIAQAVETVAGAGVVFVSSAGNLGNLNNGTSSVWEGDYRLIAAPPAVGSFDAHDFGGGANTNRITSDSQFGFSLSWSDPQQGSSNDYDLILLNSTGTTVLAASANPQDGTQEPFEFISSEGVNDNQNLLVIVKFSGSARFLHLNALGGRLSSATDGQIFGHAAAENALAVAAVDWRDAGGGGGVFNGTESVESFSSDGPRRIFYEPDGTPITPGDFLSAGGLVRQKPDVAGADGVATSTPGFNPFFGTSAAAPHVGAIAALVIENGISATVSDIREAFTTTAFDIEASGVDRDSGFGIINAIAAAEFSPCAITGISAGDQSACEPMTNTYSQDVIISYTKAPETGTLDLNGQSFAITGSPQNITLTNLTADGTSVDVSAMFSAEAGCELTVVDLYSAPVPCSEAVISCPEDVTIQCGESMDPEVNEILGFASATDACDPEPAVTFADTTLFDGCGGYTGTITRIWTAANSAECGSGTSHCTQLITIVDTIAPLLVPPPNVTIDCEASTDSSNTGAASAIDKCDGSPVVEFSDSLGGTCPAVLTRTWTTTDACGNMTSADQTIVLSPDLVGYWALDDEAGSIAADSSGNNNSGTLFNGPEWRTGRIDGSLEFDGNDDYVDLGVIETGHPLQLPEGGTIVVWMNQRAGDRWQRVVDKSTAGSGANGYALIADPFDRSIWLSVDGANYKSGPGIYAFDDWTHIAVVIAETAFEIYIDGVLTSGTFQSGSARLPPNVATTMRIGTWNHASGREFNGFLDELRTYNRALTAMEISALMAEADPDSALIAHYQLDEGEGCTTNDSIDGTASLEGSLEPNCTLTESDGPSWSTSNAISGNALEFDGNDDYVDLGVIETGHPLQLLEGGTLAVWMNQRAGDRWQRIVDKSTAGSGANGYALIADPFDRSIWLSVDGANYKSGPGVYAFDDWTHIAVVIAETAFEIYIDGVLTSGTFQSGNARLPPNVATTMRIGTWNHASGREFNGFLDELRTYNRALTAMEISALMAEADPDSALIAHYQLDEGEGCTTNDSIDGTASLEGSLEPNCTLTESDGPSWSTSNAISGNALEFDGNDDYVDLGVIETGHPLQLLEGGTLAVWMNQRAGDRWQRIVDKSTAGSGANGYALIADPFDRSIWLSVDGANYKSGPGVYAFDDWTHVAVVIAETAFEIYIDGVLTSGTFQSGSARLPPNVATTMRVGTWNHASGREFNGFLDDLRIYNRTLVATEINTIASEGSLSSSMVTNSIPFIDLHSTQAVNDTINTLNILSRTVYEDGEDKSIAGWTAFGPGQVLNITDFSGNRIISTEAKLVGDPFRLGLEDHQDWNNTVEFIAYFAVLMEEEAAVYFRVETSSGEKYLCYGPGLESFGINGGVIHFGLGIDPDGQWHAIYRDLAEDVRQALPGAEILSVKDFYVFGSVKLDDIMLLDIGSESP